jgi:hypothetical protein
MAVKEWGAGKWSGRDSKWQRGNTKWKLLLLPLVGTADFTDLADCTEGFLSVGQKAYPLVAVSKPPNLSLRRFPNRLYYFFARRTKKNPGHPGYPSHPGTDKKQAENTNK